VTSRALSLIVTAAVALGVAGTASAAPGDLDTSFAPPTLNYWVLSVAALSDGKYLIGGGFTDAGYVRVARLNADGTRDTSFTPPTLNNWVRSIAELTGGKYLIGGTFTDAGGDSNTDYVARLNADGTRDTSFAPPTLNNWVWAVAALSDGKYLIGGGFTDAGGDSNTDRVARLNADGTRDTSFTPLALNNTVLSVAALTGGKYLIGGAFRDAGGDPNTDYVARLNADGTRDTSFTPLALNNGVESIAELSDGKYLIGGTFTDAGGDSNTDYVARLNADGTRDTSFTPPTLNNQVRSIAELTGGKYLIGGDFTDAGGDSNTDRVARLNADGTRDTSFTPPTLNNLVYAVAALSDGKYLIGGGFTDAGGDSNSDYVARIEGAGAPGTPTSASATAGDAQATISWSAPSSDGGSAITSFTATASPGGATCTTSSTSCTITGLANGTSYTFTVTATNSLGTSAASSPSAAVSPTAPAPAPAAPVAAAPTPSIQAPAASLSPRPATSLSPLAITTATGKRMKGQIRSVARIELAVAGRYTFILLNAETGERIPMSRGSAIGKRTLAKASSAPVIANPATGRKLVLRSYMRRSKAPSTEKITLRVIHRAADGTLSALSVR
jgi:uncharacterized delta-60 repeat protein